MNDDKFNPADPGGDIIDVRPESQRPKEKAVPEIPAPPVPAGSPARDSSQFPPRPEYKAEPPRPKEYAGRTEYPRGTYGRKKGASKSGFAAATVAAIILTLIAANVTAFRSVSTATHSVSTRVYELSEESAAIAFAELKAENNYSAQYFDLPLVLASEITSPVETISVDLEITTLHILESEIDKIYVRWFSEIESSRQILSVEENGTELIISEKIKNSLLNFGFNSAASYAVLYLPAGYYEKINASSVSGSINANAGGYTFGEVSLSTTSGTVYTDGVYGAESTKLGTTSGDIKAYDLFSEDYLSFATTSGNTHMRNVTAENILITNISGSTSVTDVKAKGLKVSTTSGNTLISNSSADSASVSSVSGDIRFSSVNAGKMGVSTTSGGMFLDIAVFDTLYIKTVSGNTRINGIGNYNNDFALSSKTVSGKINDTTKLMNSESDRLINFSSTSGDLYIE